MSLVVGAEIISGIVALLFAGAAFANLAMSEGVPIQTMRRKALQRSKRLFLVAGVCAVVCGVCAYRAMH